MADSIGMVLISTDSMLALGIYKYRSGTPIQFDNGDILVGLTNEGYIRKINSFSVSGNEYTFQTSQGNMEDVFKNGYFGFTTATDSTLQRAASATSADGYTFNLDDIELLNDGVSSIKLTNGSITLNPNWKGAFDYRWSGLKYFELAFENATVTSHFDLVVTANQVVSLPETLKTLKRLSVWVPIPGVPVRVRMGLDFIAKYSVSIAATMTRTIGFNYTNTLNLGIKYQDGEWMPTYNMSSDKTVTPGATTANINAEVNAAIIPTFSFKFYGIVGPYLSVGVESKVEANVAFPSLDWDFWAGGWLKTTLGVNASILGRTIYNSPTYVAYTDTIAYKTPYKIIKVSGDNQIGNANQFLAQPIKVRVLDNFDNPVSNAYVHFKVTTGGGTLQDTVVNTNGDGYGETLWQLGPQFGTQYLKAETRKADGTLLQNISLEFGAVVGAICTDDSTFSDSRDGQVYTFRHIGTQVWMTKNLNYTAAGSRCYDDNGANCAVYGRLYNWNTAITVAPPGWHLPSMAEWQTLINYCGGQTMAGGAMKARGAWYGGDLTATNSSCFSGLPGGGVGTTFTPPLTFSLAILIVKVIFGVLMIFNQAQLGFVV